MQDIPFFNQIDLVIIRLVVSAVCAGVIGWDRERLRKPAGLRTHVLVGIGSCLVMLVSVVTSPEVNGIYQIDPRIAANVVVGIGFLGAGTILHLKEGVVAGLTTAATLWVVAGIGLAVGCGFYSGALFTTLFVMFALFLMNRLDDYIEGSLYHNMVIHAKMTPHLTEDAKEILRGANVKIIRVESQATGPSGKTVVVQFKPVPLTIGKQAARRIEKLKGVQEVELN